MAPKNALRVGGRTAEFLENLMTASGLSHDDLHLVGFSLGGQGVGAMGRRLEQLTGAKGLVPISHSTQHTTHIFIVLMNPLQQRK